MITFCVIPNFKGNKKDLFIALLICIALDSLYIVPLLIQ